MTVEHEAGASMKRPILIIGYQRSGTTMLRRLVSMHPDFEYELVHENPYPLVRSKNIEELERCLTYPATQEGKETGSVMSIKVGQKIPYTSYDNALRYITKFRCFFPQGGIIHIVRNPIDTLSSQMKFKQSRFVNKVKIYFRFFLNGGKFNYYIKCYFSSVPKVRAYLQNDENTLEIYYENLLKNPTKELKAIYDWIGNDIPISYIEKVISSREPWMHEGRVMPGLRYFNRIENRISKDIVLSDKQKAIINHYLEKMAL